MRVVMQCIHFTNTMLLLAAITLTWWWLRDRPQPSTGLRPQARTVAWISLIATLFVGGTGSVAALADTLFPPTSLQAAFLQDFTAHSPLLVRMRWLHPATAVIALSCAIWIALQLRTKLGQLLVGLVCVQILLGAADVLLLAPTWLQVVHLLGADLYWIALVVACASILAPTHADLAAAHASSAATT